jgi:hypothetical protein
LTGTFVPLTSLLIPREMAPFTWERLRILSRVIDIELFMLSMAQSLA